MNAPCPKVWQVFLVIVWVLGTTIAGVPAGAAEAEEPDRAARLLQEGRTYFEAGALDKAVGVWKEAALLFGQAKAEVAESRVRTYLAQTYQALGRHQEALEQLELALALAQQAGAGEQTVAVLAALGSSYTALGQLDAATQFLEDAREQAQGLEHAGLLAGILNEQGRLSAIQGHYAEAMAAFDRSATLAKDSGNEPLHVRALINAAQAAMRLKEATQAKVRLDEARRQAERLAAFRDKVYTLIGIALGYDGLRAELSEASDVLLVQAAGLLKEAAMMAEAQHDARSSSYAWGHLGHLYETEHRYEEALELTHRAVLAAQEVEAPESLFQWQWQTGRLLAAQGKLDAAITAYRLAVATLQSIRQEVAASLIHDPQGFPTRMRPLYFELADLLLKRAELTADRAQVEPYLREARQVVELLKAAEIRNYFGDECVDALRARETSLDDVSETAAVIYPLVFPDRLELLVSLSTGLERVSVPVGAERLRQEVQTFRRFLEKRTTREYLPHAKQVYEWVIRPLEPLLSQVPIETLVFVPDGPLREIPMAALHDGEHFLIDTYAIAATPSLTLTDPYPLNREDIKVLAVGLTESVQGYPPLPYVSQELEAVRKLYGGDQLVNEDYVASKFEEELKDETFTIVHIASHGQFQPQADASFVLTFDGKLTMSQLDQFIGLFRFRSHPLELLTLSACNTAAGDERAALGLAGVAIRAGARSALATLWFINDQASSVLVTEFYRQLKQGDLSKAEALRQAQLMMIRDPLYRHPAYWAPFLVLNNWL